MKFTLSAKEVKMVSHFAGSKKLGWYTGMSNVDRVNEFHTRATTINYPFTNGGWGQLSSPMESIHTIKTKGQG